MAVLKCKMCGASLNVVQGTAVCRCEYCGTSQTLPQTDSDRMRQLFDRANTLRLANDFDGAAAAYENIISEYPDEAEAHWGICLCRYGIEYVKDRRTGKRIATCRRTQFRSILEDPDFAMAVRYADSAAEMVYREEAAYIDAVQKKILEISAGEEPFDIFICYKETDDIGNRTTDSVIAQDIYDTLTSRGYRVFFSRITLETKLGREFEPYIFAALNSSEIMLVVGTRPDNFMSPWVRNEWSRFMALIEQGKKKAIIPCYRDMSPYELPDELRALQSQDVSKIGYMQDLVRGIEKLLGEKKGSSTAQAGYQIPPEALIDRAAIFIEDGSWNSAAEYCEKALDADPKNAKAYLIKLMADLKIRHVNEFMEVKEPFGHNYSYEKAVRFADPIMKGNLQKYEMNARYLYAVSLLEEGRSKDDAMKARQVLLSLGSYRDSAKYRAAAEQRIAGYEEEYFNEAKDLISSAKHGNDLIRAKKLLAEGIMTEEAAMLIKQCDDKLETLYCEAKNIMAGAKTSAEYKDAYERFEYLGDYRDSNSMEFICSARYQDTLDYEKELEAEQKRRAESEKIEREIMLKAEIEEQKARDISSKIIPLGALTCVSAYITFKMYDKVQQYGYILEKFFIIMVIASCMLVVSLLLFEGLFNGKVCLNKIQFNKMVILFVTGATTLSSMTIDDGTFVHGGISLAMHAVFFIIGMVFAKKIGSVNDDIDDQ